jgi:uncharacterized protein (TIRG00374 family)
LFLYFVLRQIDLRSAWQYIQAINPAWLLAAVVVYTTAFVVRCVRWQILLAPLKHIPANNLFSYLILGFFMNNLLPLRLGEFVRAHITGTKTGISRSSVLATVVVERLFDALSYIALFLITVMFLPFPPWVKKSFSAGSGVFLAGFVVLLVVARNQQAAIAFISRLPLPAKIAEFTRRIIISFIGGLDILHHTRQLIAVLCLSLVVWTIEASVFWMLSIAFGLNISYMDNILVMIMIGIGAMLPTAPGYVGTVEFMGVNALSILGIEKTMAFAFIVTVHTLQLVTIFTWGIVSLWREKISFSELFRMQKSR